jgi:uncharacterized protein
MPWVLLVLLLCAAAIWGWYSSSLVIIQERLPIQAIPASFGLRAEDVSFSASDGVSLAGWFVPAQPSSGAARADTTIVVCHGWGANRSDVLSSTVFLNLRGGYNLLYFDFRNHGESDGKRSSLGAFESWDLEGAIDFLRKQKPDKARRLGVFGLSMGGAVSLTVAAQRPEVEAVVADSAFSSFNDVVARFARLFYHVPRYPLIPVTLLFTKLRLGVNPEAYSPIHHMHKISPRPVFLIQGDRDVRMPPSEGARLFAAAKEPKLLWTVSGADHGETAALGGREYEDKILDFFQRAFQGRPVHGPAGQS